MVKAAFVLALVSAALSGWLAFERYGGCASCRAHDAHDAAPATAPDDRVAALERRLAALEARPALADLGPTASAGRSAGASLSRRGPEAGTVADLERRLAKLEDSHEKLATAIESSVHAPAEGGQVVEPVEFEGPTFLNTVDDAAKHLDLSPAQRADLERIAADAKARIDELKKIPDEDGKTWEDAAKSVFEPKDDASGGGIRVMMGDSSKVRAFREKTIPGRNESYGSAERKILADAKAQVRSTLTPEQQTKWDKARSEPMLGGEADDAFSFITVVGGSVVTGPTPPPPPAK